MTFTKLIVVLAFLATGALVAHEPKATQVLSKDLTDIPGKNLRLVGARAGMNPAPIFGARIKE